MGALSVVSKFSSQPQSYFYIPSPLIVIFLLLNRYPTLVHVGLFVSIDSLSRRAGSQLVM